MIKIVTLFGLLLTSGMAHAFDHSHAVWDELLKRHVILLAEGNASRVDYAGMQADQSVLDRYLDGLSAVSLNEYQAWNRPQRLAFLINAYNAFTVKLILTAYPDISSIKDLGSLFRSPWKRRFFSLLGERRHLDNLEQDLMRAPGVFDEPRIHFALNCASIGCPMLRNEAYTGMRLDEQLEDALGRFLSDRERNHFDTADNTLWVSKIFDWYEEDFTLGAAEDNGIKVIFSRFAERLADEQAARRRLREGDYRIDFLDYDWRLNDIPARSGLSRSSHNRKNDTEQIPKV